MAPGGCSADPEGVHNGPSTQTTPSASCCGSPVQVVALTRDDAPGARVELIRCSSCGQSAWSLDGVDVPKDRALAALSAAFTSTAPRSARPTGVRPPAADGAPRQVAAATGAELAGLLTGWQVLGR